MDREQILAFRLRQHRLVERLPRAKLELAASSGILNGLGGMAPMALSARVDAFAEEDLDEAVFRKKSLVAICGPRAAVWLVPTQDFDVFTLGAAPESEDDIAKFIGTAKDHLAKGGVRPKVALERVVAATRSVLSGDALTQDEVHEEWRKKLPREMLYSCKGCKSRHVHWMLVGAAGLQQAFCYGALREGDSAFVRPEDWLPKKRRKLSRQEATRELLRKYLRYYGPSDAKGFIGWSGLSSQQGNATWQSAGDGLAEVKIGGKKGRPAWMLRGDAKALDAAGSSSVKSVRFLPPRDPFLDLRDREVLVPNAKARSRVWRVLGNPGVVLVDGEIVGTWRAKKKGKALDIQVEALRAMTKSDRSRMEEEAALVASVKGAEGARLILNL